MRSTSSLPLILAFCGGSAAALSAQTVEFIVLAKGIEYEQTDATTVSLMTSDWEGWGGPYNFDASVQGESLDGITPPTLTGPITATEGTPGLPDAAFINGGVLAISPWDGSWGFGSDGDNFSTDSKAKLDSAFGNGTYTFTVMGTALELSLSPEAYPNALQFTLTAVGGEWVNGRYHVPYDAELTITTNAFPGFGTSVEGAIWMDVRGENDGYNSGDNLVLSTSNPASEFLSLTIPANTFTAGNRYALEGGFFGATELIDDHASFPGALIVAGFEVATAVEIVATPLPDPQPVAAEIDTAIAVRFPTQNGARYLIEESTDLENWHPVRSNLHGDGGTRTEFFERHHPSQYYRVTRTFP
jgi:hypothetical protein